MPITVVAGPDEYLFGEEKALLEVIEGKPPLPRLLPPYEHGLFATAPQMGWESATPEPGHGPAPDLSNPTLVNNVETLANVPHILARGAEWFRAMGTADSPGHARVHGGGRRRPSRRGEIDLGTPLAEVIERVGGGPRPGGAVKAVFSGVANPVITADTLDTPRHLRGHGRHRQRDWAPSASPSTTTPPAWWRWRSSSPASSTSSRAASARRASSAPRRSPTG